MLVTGEWLAGHIVARVKPSLHLRVSSFCVSQFVLFCFSEGETFLREVKFTVHRMARDVAAYH